MIDLQWPLMINIIVFAAAAAAIGATGTWMAGLADRLADRTGLGEAVTGTMFLGLVTALPGITASVTAALDGRPALAIGNAMGGIAVQTLFLAVADIAYRKANLEHAAASASNMLQATVLIVLLTVVLLTIAGPDVTVGHVHPTTPVLFVVAGFGFAMVLRTSEQPMWQPRQTDETVEDVPDAAAQHESLAWLLTWFVLASVIVLTSGSLVAITTGRIGDQTGIDASIMGGLFSAVATSLPELVTTVAAVRRGALTLAVSDIVGGNFFDVLFVCAADIAFLRGSLYHAAGVGEREVFIIALTILMNVVLLMGLIYRQKRGVGNIGFESVCILLLYGCGFVVLSVWM